MRNTIDASKLELTETIVNIRRVAKTVKGGRNMRFSVTVVVGDGEGHVGVGLGKAWRFRKPFAKRQKMRRKTLSPFQPLEQLFLTDSWACSAQAECS